METYEEWQKTKAWFLKRVKEGDLTQEDIDTYLKVTKMMYGRAYECLDCHRNDGNFQKGECYNCSVWE